jgi:hypothetical protein
MLNGERAVIFEDAADVESIMAEVAERWKEQPLLTGVTLRAVIPFAQAMATLAREIQDIKTRLSPSKLSANAKQH